MARSKRKKMAVKRRCQHCNCILDSIWFTGMMTEEWSWNGEGYNECSARNSLITEPEQPVRCPHCDKIIGTGIDFGFGTGCK